MIIADKEYKVVIERKRIKNIYLRVKGDALLITCPYYVTNKEIEKFIYLKLNWIYKTVNRKTNDTKLNFNNSVFYKGKEYRLIILQGNKNINIDEDTITVRCKSGDKEDAINVFYELSKNKLLEDIFRLQDRYLSILKDYGYNKQPVYHVKNLKSMWGVCYNKKNIINISCKLIHFDDECLETILWHELLHFIIPNHSKRFYDVIELYMPKYKEILKTIK